MAVRSAISDLHRRLLSRELTVSQICDSSLNIAKQTKYLNAFVTLTANEVRQRAKKCDQILSSLDSKLYSTLSPLFGVPIAIKDNFCTRNIKTTCGSLMLSNYVPPYDATIVDRLFNQSNAIMIGKTNLDEFAMGSSSITSHYGPTANPWKSFGQPNFKQPSSPNFACPPPTPRSSFDFDQSSDWYMAGGSSTGSAVAVATGACLAAIGTDTGGSNRHPASMVGIVGFKPTYGMISRFGMIPLAHSLDTVSILSRYVADTELVFDTLMGVDSNDLTSQSAIVADQNTDTTTNRRVITIGIPRQFGHCDHLTDEVSSLWNDIADQLSKHNRYRIVNVDMPNIVYASHCYAVLSCCEVASNMACYDGVKYGYSVRVDASAKSQVKFDRDDWYRSNRDQGFGNEVKKRILCGNYFLHGNNRQHYYEQALKLRRLIADDFERVFDSVDALLTPSTPSPAISHLEWTQKQTDNQLFHEDFCLIPSNLSHTPAISIPAGTSQCGLPLSLQLIGRRNCDKTLLSMARDIETLLGYERFLEFVDR
ncbi:Glutamyl-tRNA(Gln) amidotransferase subunit A, mitochondrial, partial [Fragariocoptes setiger]